MTRFLLFIILLFLILGAAFAVNQVAVQGGQVTVKGQYTDIGKTVVVSTGAVTDKAGQCEGLLCSITYN